MLVKQTQHRKQNINHERAAGFTLVEVLVALIIIAVGMLGLAKIQALAYASTGIAGSQSLAALQASSLASAMRANRSYWSTVTTPYSFSFSNVNGTVTYGTLTDNTLSTTTFNCASGGATAPCTPAQLAAYDLSNTSNGAARGWIKGLAAVLPNPSATISCPTPAAGAQLGCSIQITWAENTVTVNSQTQGSTAFQAQSYAVFVVP
jgi:type IV pilus assembly protein PilV